MAQAVAGFFNADAVSGAHTQVVNHGLGQVPKGMILFANFTAGTGFDTGGCPRFFGFVDQDRNGYSQSSFDADNVSSGGDYGYRIANSALAFVTHTTLFHEFSISAWTSTTFTVNWTAKADTATPGVAYILIGGSARTKALAYTITSGTGNKSVTGAGFQPQGMLCFSIPFSGSLPQFVTTTAVAHHQLGATDGSGQWAYYLRTLDNGVLSDCAARLDTDQCIAGFQDAGDSATHVQALLASFVSWDSDGATFNFSANEYQANGGRTFFFFIRGLQGFKVGNITKPQTTTGNQDTTGLGFNPQTVLLASSEESAGSTISDGFGCFGVFDSDTGVAYNWMSDFGSGTSDVSAGLSTAKAFRKIENHTETVNAEADGSLLADGFRLNWTTNDAEAGDIIGYVAFGSQAGGGPGGPGGGGKKPPKGHDGAKHWPYSIGHEGEELY